MGTSVSTSHVNLLNIFGIITLSCFRQGKNIIFRGHKFDVIHDSTIHNQQITCFCKKNTLWSYILPFLFINVPNQFLTFIQTILWSVLSDVWPTELIFFSLPTIGPREKWVVFVCRSVVVFHNGYSQVDGRVECGAELYTMKWHYGDVPGDILNEHYPDLHSAVSLFSKGTGLPSRQKLFLSSSRPWSPV